MITVLGAANADIQAFVSRRLSPGDSSPGRITATAGGVARNIAHNLCLLGGKVRFITALADDGNSKMLVSGMTSLGMDISPSVIFPGARTSSYVCILDEKGVLFGAVADMDLIEGLPPEPVEKALSLFRSEGVFCQALQVTRQTQPSPRSKSFWVQKRFFATPSVAFLKFFSQ